MEEGTYTSQKETQTEKKTKELKVKQNKWKLQ